MSEKRELVAALAFAASPAMAPEFPMPMAANMIPNRAVRRS